MSIFDRYLAEQEVLSLGLPRGACCCPDHGHSWYERVDGDASWYECNACSDLREASDD